MMMKLITRINELVSIWADESQYVVRIQTRPKQSIKHASNSYLPSLEMCFEEVFEHLCRNRLADEQDKDLKEVAQIIVMTKQEIKNIMQPFVELREEIKGRHGSAGGGKGGSKSN